MKFAKAERSVCRSVRSKQWGEVVPAHNSLTSLQCEPTMDRSEGMADGAERMRSCRRGYSQPRRRKREDGLVAGS